MDRREGADTGRPGRRRILFAGVVLVVTALVAYTSALNVGAAGPQVEIKNHKYSPATLTVPVGTTVTWTNHDDDVHTVVSMTEKFKSRAIDSDETFSQKFIEPGTYEYFCTLHPLMKAKVTVK